MSERIQFTATNRKGDIVPGAVVYVYKESDGLLASIFTEGTLTTPKGNPFVADADGYAFFYAADGLYKIVVQGGGAFRTLRDLAIGVGDIAFDELSDVVITSVEDKQGILYDATTGKFVNANLREQNFLINGNFMFNQRGFGGGALTSGNYGYDRWKAGGSTATISGGGGNSGRPTLTHTSGPLVQVVESALWGFANLSSKTFTISVGDLTGGNLTVSFGSASGTIVAGSGRRSVTLTTASGDTGNLSLTLTPASGAVTYREVKLELGSVASAYVPRPFALELLMCKRYYHSTYPIGTAPGAITSSGAVGFGSTTAGAALRITVPYPTYMRTSPTVTFYAVATGNVGKWTESDGVTDTAASPLVLVGHPGQMYMEVYTAFGTDNRVFGHFTLSAEL